MHPTTSSLELLTEIPWIDIDDKDKLDALVDSTLGLDGLRPNRA